MRFFSQVKVNIALLLIVVFSVSLTVLISARCDAAAGALLWSVTTGGPITSSPAVANGVVYVGSADKTLYALNARAGKKLWSSITGNTITSSPAIANGIVYVGSNDNNLYAFHLPGMNS